MPVRDSRELNPSRLAEALLLHKFARLGNYRNANAAGWANGRWLIRCTGSSPLPGRLESRRSRVLELGIVVQVARALHDVGRHARLAQGFRHFESTLGPKPRRKLLGADHVGQHRRSVVREAAGGERRRCCGDVLGRRCQGRHAPGRHVDAFLARRRAPPVCFAYRRLGETDRHVLWSFLAECSDLIS